jgi:sugar phosphate isomerase/epimerase
MQMTDNNKFRKHLSMRKLVVIGISFFMGMSACKKGDPAGIRIFEPDKLIAWCIVPFDAVERTPLERAEMLKNLGLRHLAYDYREKHIPLFREEIETLKVQGIALDAVWLWADPRWENPIDEAGRQVLDILGETGTRTEIWLGFPENAFEGVPDEGSLSRSVEVVKKILQECEELGCTLALYNHGGWFGEPDNLVRIVESAGPDKLRIVYNFHHGHHQAEDFQENLEKMLPYLSTININGMRLEGPKILTLGEGDLELEMLRNILDSGYKGPIGILGHTEGEDIRLVLERNLKGLEELKKQL